MFIYAKFLFIWFPNIPTLGTLFQIEQRRRDQVKGSEKNPWRILNSPFNDQHDRRFKTHSGLKRTRALVGLFFCL